MKFIQLNTFLKLKGVADSGGEAKNLIRSGIVFLNGEEETRNKKKLFPNDIIEVKFEDEVLRFEVEEDEIK